MNVSNLSDVELNRVMHRFYWVSGGESDYDKFHDSIPASRFNYLTDWHLTMPLAVENKLCVDFEGFWSKDFERFLGSTQCCDVDGRDFINDNPLRAICEVLVMIALERKS